MQDLRVPYGKPSYQITGLLFYDFLANYLGSPTLQLNLRYPAHNLCLYLFVFCGTAGSFS